MRSACSAILACLLVLAGTGAGAQEPVPRPVSARFPNIRASLEDGFYSLAEQQARGALQGEVAEADANEAVLLLVHALWGQKRYSEMLDLLARYGDAPGFTYWQARAYYELRQFGEALDVLQSAVDQMAGSRFAPAALRLQGSAQLAEGDHATAAATFERFAREFPQHPDRIANQFNLAEAYASLKRIPEAIGIYESIAAGAGPQPAQRARLKLAHLLYTQGATENFDAARAIFEGLATNVQTRLAYRIDACVDRAALEEAAGNLPGAAAALRQAIELSPDANQRVPLKLTLARLLLRTGDLAGALKLLEECRTEAPNEAIAAELQLEKAGVLLRMERFKEADEAFQIYLDVADNQAGLARAWLGKGMALLRMDRFAEAAAMLDKASKGLDDPSMRADALFKAADAYYLTGKYDEAEKRYYAFATGFPGHANAPNALYQLGLSLVNLGRLNDALGIFRNLEADFPQSLFAHEAALRTADVLRASQQWDQALAKYAQIGQTYTNSATAAFCQHQQGLVLYQLGRYAEAQKMFDLLLARYPESTWAPQASYMRGFCLYYLGQPEEAVKTCREFIDAYPDSEWVPEVVFWLAEQYYNLGQYREAEPLFLRVAQEFSASKLAPRAMYWAGRAAAAQLNYTTAVERYSEVAKGYPSSDILPQTRFAQGDALTELGEFSRAILAFEEIIKNYPDSPLLNAAWGRKGDCQFSMATENPGRYGEAMNSYQAILDRPTAPVSLRLQAAYKVGRCLEKMNSPDKAFSRYMDVVYTFASENAERSSGNVMWFTRAAFGAAAIKERNREWVEAARIYGRVVDANVPAREEALKRIEKIRSENWLLFQQAEEADNARADG